MLEAAVSELLDVTHHRGTLRRVNTTLQAYLLSIHGDKSAAAAQLLDAFNAANPTEGATADYVRTKLREAIGPIAEPTPEKDQPIGDKPKWPAPRQSR